MGKVAIITGATGNLGTAVTEKFIAEGYMVFGTIEPGMRTEAHQDTDNLQYWEADLTDEEVAKVFLKEILDECGHIDALVMLVGGFAMGSIEDTSTEEIDHMIKLNFNTAYHLARPYLQITQKQKSMGRLVFVGARPALELHNASSMAAYALSKSMVVNLAEIINADSAKHNATASVIVPSIIDTPPNRKAMPTADHSKWVSPQAIADTIAFICSDQSASIRQGVYKLYGGV